MYAVIRTGGKQLRVSKGDTVQVEKLNGVAGDLVHWEDVLLVADGDKIQVGAPVVEGAMVSGKILKQGKGKKLIHFRFRRRKDSMVKKGHRQPLTVVEITDIGVAKA